MLQQIPITISTDDDLLAAMLRLISAQGLTVTVDAIERPGVDEAERLLLSIELPTRNPENGWKRYVRERNAEIAAAFADEAVDPFAPATASATTPTPAVPVYSGSGIELDLQPADGDAVYRPHRGDAAEPADDKRDEIDKQLLIVSRLADRPGLGDVCRHLLRPLAGKGWHIDGDREAVLFRRAEEFGSYRPSMLKAAAEYLLRGKHTHFPDTGEIMKALGWAAAPGRTAHEAKAA